MITIRFTTVVDDKQVIRPPAGIVLPHGELEVIVHPVPAPSDDPLAPTRNWLLALAAEVERQAPDLPSDVAEHHDHYAHGKPLS